MTNEVAKVEEGVTNAAEFPINIAIAAFLNRQHERGRFNETLKTYRKALNQFLKRSKIYDIRQFDSHAVNQFLLGLSDVENTNTGNKLSTRTKRLYRAVLMKFTKFLYHSGVIEKDFSSDFTEFKLGNEDYHARDALTCKDAKKLLNVFKRKVAENSTEENLRNYAICRLLLSCGLRCVEACRLTVDSIHEVDGIYFIGVIGKGRTTPEDVRLPREVKAAIDAYLKVRKARADEKAMFVSCKKFRGKAISTQMINLIIKRGLVAAGILDGTTEKVEVFTNGVRKLINRRADKNYYRKSAHSARHFSAIEQLKQNIPLEWIRKNLRHKNLSVTTIYLNDSNKLKNNGIDLVDGVLDDTDE